MKEFKVEREQRRIYMGYIKDALAAADKPGELRVIKYHLRNAEFRLTPAQKKAVLNAIGVLD